MNHFVFTFAFRQQLCDEARPLDQMQLIRDVSRQYMMFCNSVWLYSSTETWQLLSRKFLLQKST